MRVLVTGGAGYLGRHVCAALAKDGLHPVVFDNLSTGQEAAVKHGPMWFGDLVNPDDIEAAFQIHSPDAVIHCAAYSSVAEGEADHAKYRDNVVGTANLAGAARDLPMVFASSAAVYGEGRESLLNEDAPTQPVNFYGRTKLACEAILPRAMSLRLFNIAGGGGDPNGHIVPRTLLSCKGSVVLERYGDGSCVRDYVHVEEVASVMVAALRAGPGVLNICSGSGRTVSEVVSACERASGRQAKIRQHPPRQGDPAILVGDPSAAEKRLGWRAQATLDEIAASAWEALAWG